MDELPPPVTDTSLNEHNIHASEETAYGMAFPSQKIANLTLDTSLLAAAHTFGVTLSHAAEMGPSRTEIDKKVAAWRQQSSA